jgi:hypothetical protein
MDYWGKKVYFSMGSRRKAKYNKPALNATFITFSKSDCSELEPEISAEF